MIWKVLKLNKGIIVPYNKVFVKHISNRQYILF